MKLVKINDDIYIDPKEIVSLELDKLGYYGDSYGTTITLVNGRKILAREKTPSQIIEIIEKTTKDSEGL